MLFRALAVFGALKLLGKAHATNIKVLLKDGSGNALFCTGTATPPAKETAVTGYAKGCIYIKTDVAADTGGIYANMGTTSIADFTLVTQAAT